MTEDQKLAALEAEAAELRKKDDLTEADVDRVEEIAKEYDDRKAFLKRRQESNDRLKAMISAPANTEPETPGTPLETAKSLGDHFVKSVGDRLRALPGGRGGVSAPEYVGKAAADTQVTGGHDGPLGVLLTDLDRTIVKTPRRQTVTGLFGQGAISGQAITYMVEQGREGNFATVAEAGQMPQIHYEDPTFETDALSKVAGFIKMSDEMLLDLDFLVSEINGRLIYDLSLVEEAQVLAGDGTGTDLLGLLNRDGLQVGTTDQAGLADEIFRSMTKIENATGLTADALVINPSDYQELVLSKDGNSQYYAGGFFTGQYGQGGIMERPAPWGLRAVVTPAVAAGSPVVGAFKTAGTVYRKGGVNVEATNTDQGDFTKGLFTLRATERLALAVRRPAGFVKLTIS